MAIKVNGTTVIDDSRNLSNVGGLKTVNGNSLVGSGNISAGASTTGGAVGTYTYGRPENATDYNVGDTASSIKPTANSSYNQNARYNAYGYWNSGHRGSTLSGTWRCMADAYSQAGAGADAFPGLWVRIS